jgi:hypothetical protein
MKNRTTHQSSLRKMQNISRNSTNPFIAFVYVTRLTSSASIKQRKAETLLALYNMYMSQSTPLLLPAISMPFQSTRSKTNGWRDGGQSR